MSIPIFKPYIKRKDMDAVLSCMVSDSLEAGDYSLELIEELKRSCRSRACFLFREYERSITLALEALSLQEGQEFILSPLAPISYLRVVLALGLRPVFVDIDPRRGVFDLEDVLDRVGKQTGAILLSPPFGYQWDFEGWEDPGVPVIEDITANFGSLRQGVRAGQRGDLVLMRLEAPDLITAGGGTALLVSRESLVPVVENLASRYDPSIYLSDMNAALGLMQARGFEKNFEVRDEIYQLFLSSLQKSHHSSLVEDEQERRARPSFPVIVKGSRKEVQGYAQKRGVQTALAFRGCCLEAKGDYGPCSQAEALVLSCVLFPLYPSLGKTNVEGIVKVLATLP